MGPEERSLTLLRRQRHDFMNHLQVISGWIQLGKPERALQYLQGVTDRMTVESGLVRNLPPSVALSVVELGLEAATHGVHVDWDLAGEVVPPAFRETVLAEIVKVSAMPEAQRRLRVQLQPDGRLTIHTATVEGTG